MQFWLSSRASRFLSGIACDDEAEDPPARSKSQPQRSQHAKTLRMLRAERRRSETLQKMCMSLQRDVATLRGELMSQCAFGTSSEEALGAQCVCFDISSE